MKLSEIQCLQFIIKEIRFDVKKYKDYKLVKERWESKKYKSKLDFFKNAFRVSDENLEILL